MGVNHNFRSELTVSLSRLVACGLILPLTLLSPLLGVSEAVAQNKESVREETSYSSDGNRSSVRNELPESNKRAPIRRPVWNVDFVSAKVALRQPGSFPAAVTQNSTQTSQDASSSTVKKKSKLMWILVAAAGGAAAGAFALKGSGGSGSSTSYSSGPTITAGPPVVGPPQ